jgi:hypothetical protein
MLAHIDEAAAQYPPAPVRQEYVCIRQRLRDREVLLEPDFPLHPIPHSA